jgi:hypothetical protein
MRDKGRLTACALKGYAPNGVSVAPTGSEVRVGAWLDTPALVWRLSRGIGAIKEGRIQIRPYENGLDESLQGEAPCRLYRLVYPAL